METAIKELWVEDSPTTLWKLARDDREVACRARLAPYGIEIEIVHDGAVILTRVFETDAEALAWAQVKRAAREAQGWAGVPHDSGGPAKVE